MELKDKIDLPSGATLQIQLAPFADAKNLYQALLREAKSITLPQKADMGDLYKDLFCAGFSSPQIEDCIWTCMKGRCLYNDFKIDSKTFEPEAARDDYMKVLMEVVKANVLPFMKSLYVEYRTALDEVTKNTRA